MNTGNIITKHKKGYAHHPETMRWRGKLTALYSRHSLLVNEMLKRGYNHKSNLDVILANDKSIQDVFVNTIAEQEIILKNKDCECFM